MSTALSFPTLCYSFHAGWSSLVARWTHNPKVVGSNPTPATNPFNCLQPSISLFMWLHCA
jgi:hypothetical protein